MDAKTVIETLGLVPHPEEGGFFKETYRAKEFVLDKDPTLRKGDYVASTAIYYLLTPETFSEFHTLHADEVFHYYLGDPVEQWMLFPDGTGTRVVLGPEILAGQLVQHRVPQGVWQGARLVEGGSWALLGCTVAPGFEYRDYRRGVRSKLQALYPRFAEEITALTHPEDG